MKIAYVVPGPMDYQEVVRRGELLKQWASPGTQVDIVRTSHGPASIESMYEEYLAIPETAKMVYQLERQGYDAAIIGCAGDPGLDAYREITSGMLVVGPGASSMHLAALLGYRFTILTVAENTVASSYELAMKAGLREKVASVLAVEIPVLELAQNRDETLQKLISIGKKAIQQDRADCLVLGCMSMGFLHVAEDMQEALSIPVINPAKTALKIAESLVSSGLTHSKKAYLLPPKLANGRVTSLDELDVNPT
ncbi:hydrogenase expression protein HupH [Brevibacillus fluminis]|uniref:Hydrogenase expression protein HupH n=1 Tax=Brevibacillus fluminis TaxID=511487 RepID=A0A3M8DHX0_9BACL|nr:aspartate/glutamate racemase family protein [Brevibacillus fluminis]RNB87693.1 hydrogenase expression protein HupH [Brevibacillus fluminis]